MLNKLIISFIAATQDKCTKRGVEWVMADFIYCVYILIMLVAMVAFISFNTWYVLLFVYLTFVLLMSGWGWFAFKLRKTLLTMLYPPTEHSDENGDSEEEALDRINDLMQKFTNQMYNMKDVLK